MIDLSSLEFAELLRPIPGDDPAGEPRAYAHRLHDVLSELRREDDSDDYDQATRPAELKRADWAGVLDVAEHALQEETKDLRVACHLVEALVRMDGLSGLHQGLVLLRTLSEQCWDRLNPPLEAEDPETRAAPLSNMLDDPYRGPCFPNLVRSIPILGSGDAACSFLEWRKLQATNGQGTDRRAQVLAATERRQLQTLASDADKCLTQLEEFRQLLNDRLGAQAPGFMHLGEAITDCQQLVEQALAEVGQPLDMGDSSTDPESSNLPETPGAASALDAIGVEHGQRLRGTAYQQIQAAARTLRQLEPHSPVPYLILRAVELGSMPFPRMIQQFVREENILSEMYRELGIEPSEGEQSPHEVL